MNPVRVAVFALVASLALALAACGGGGGGGGTTPVLPPSTSPPTTAPHGTSSPTGVPSRSPSASPSANPSTTPVRSATPAPTPTVAPTASATYYPADAPSKIRSSYGRIGLSQIFDYFPTDGTTMSASQISSDASRYDTVWGSFDPQPWRASNPQALTSRYYIIEGDSELISGHTLQWWQQNHPDWILYACDSSGNPTQDIAYVPDDGYPDVPLDIHNPAVVQYQIQQSLVPYAIANNYNALALDEVIFTDVLEGGNPNFGQTVKSGEYGCGIYNQDGTFTKIYQSTTDPTWEADIVNWVEQAHAAASAQGLAIIANHPEGAYSRDANETTLLQNIDVTLDEAGFSDYGNYAKYTALFNSVYHYAEWVQQQGKGFMVIDRYATSGETEPSSDQTEYSIATYLMINEGNADLYINANNGSGYGYGSEQYHQEYATPIGFPCSAMTQDPVNQQIFYRRFSGGMVVVNSGSSAAENATLPSNHTYTDIEGRPVTDPLPVQSNDAYVLTTTSGCS